MESNTLKAIINIKNLNNYDLDTIYPPESEMVANNRIQAVGARLEAFIKDALTTMNTAAAAEQIEAGNSTVDVEIEKLKKEQDDGEGH